MQSEPRHARTSVWAFSISLAATLEIEFSFSSSGYLDVSVHRVPGLNLWIQLRSTRVFLVRLPHSDICGSMNICFSPQLFAAYHVFHRLLVPRHPPCALLRLTSAFRQHSVVSFVFYFGLFSDVLSIFVDFFCFVLSCQCSVKHTAFLKKHGLKWTRTTDLTLIRRAL